MKTIDFKIDYYGIGCSSITMEVAGKKYEFLPSYMNQNPLNSLMQSLYLLASGDSFPSEINVIWQGEPEGQIVSLAKSDGDLHIVISQFSDTKSIAFSRISLPMDLHPIIDVHADFNEFVKTVCLEAQRVLCNLGFRGYYETWHNHENFPISEYLYFMNAGVETDDDGVSRSSIHNEIMKFT